MTTTLETAKNSIKKAIRDNNGRFSHNLVSAALRIVAKEYDNEQANKLIDEFDLTELYGIRKVK